jgi:hypothetical protein
MVSEEFVEMAFGGRGLPAPPFDAENLTYAFGFPVPPPFVTLLNALCEGCGSAAAAYNRFEEAFGSDLTDHDIRDGYDLSPPELFPFAATGGDGGHFGYVIHAPELPATDYPVGRFEPSDTDDGVYLLGATTFEAAETVLSAEMNAGLEFERQYGDRRSAFSSEWWPEVAARLRGLGIHPSPAKDGRNYENGNGKPVTPILIPDGWRHVPSADRVGVLAPAALFHPTPLPALKRLPDVSAILDAAWRHAADRFPATALWLLREGYFLSYGAIELYPAMIDAYQALGRPSLAAVVSRRMGMGHVR